MKKVLIMIIMALVAGCATPQPRKIDLTRIPVKGGNTPATTGSIWPGETSRNAFFQDLRAKNVGDIVTVRIIEKTSAINGANTSTARASSNDISISRFFGMPLNFGMRDFLGQGQPFSPEVQSSYDAEFDGSGTTSRSGELSAVIATRVVEVLQNGNLVLEGRKDTIVNNEQQYIVLSGIARPEDINEENVIPSILLSDAKIEYSGSGVVADGQSPGWLRRILDNVWPF
ncbi:MAG: flagellar basal body L-ring protein FlgH [Deltaproteobacteria bacterium]|nr:flagellar basal body L-ring protein FlgH [Deltaproteobacteria bacterium]MBZ0219259.1 flagellar basal body L-ring protein FlgH [Deltaproteobacteria bacterium]